MNLGKYLNLEKYLESYSEKIGLLEEMVVGVITTDLINTLIVSGSSGVGKTYNINRLLQKQSEDENNPIKYRKVTGKITPLAFFNVLYENSTYDSVCYFDDADSILSEETSLNLLKEASEKVPQRIISYLSTRLGESKGSNTTFDGKIIISTNIKISKSAHLMAVYDRFHVMELNISYLEKLAKIQDIVDKSAPEHRDVNQEVLKFLIENESILETDNVTIRTFIKLQELARLTPRNWRRIAEISETYFTEKKKKITTPVTAPPAPVCPVGSISSISSVRKKMIAQFTL
jgi:hypothetical protein